MDTFHQHNDDESQQLNNNKYSVTDSQSLELPKSIPETLKSSKYKERKHLAKIENMLILPNKCQMILVDLKSLKEDTYSTFDMRQQSEPILLREPMKHGDLDPAGSDSFSKKRKTKLTFDLKVNCNETLPNDAEGSNSNKDQLNINATFKDVASSNQLKTDWDKFMPTNLYGDLFKQVLSFTLSNENISEINSENKNNKIAFNENIRNINFGLSSKAIEKYEEVLKHELDHIKEIKESLKMYNPEFLKSKLKDSIPIFIYHSNNWKAKRNWIKTKKSCMVEESKVSGDGAVFIDVKDEALKEDEVRLQKNTSQQFISKSIQNPNPGVIDKVNPKGCDINGVRKENFLNIDSLIPLSFKYGNGKMLRFKIRYLSKMGHAFKAYFSRMNISFIADMRFTKEDGTLVSYSDTPYSLHLKPNDVIVISGP